jgi:nitrate/nitrite transport system substrate-binding protein
MKPTSHPEKPSSPNPETDNALINTSLSRRQFLRRTGGLTAASLLAGLPTGWMGSVYASDAPEIPNLSLGIIALTDCAPLVIAYEQGLFKKYGIKATIAKQANWAAVRDSLFNNAIQGTHILLGNPIAFTMGLLGSPKNPVVMPWIINRNGQAITLKNDLKGKVGADAKALKPFVDAAKKSGTPMTFAMTFPPGTHAMWTRYWLASGGINPDTDVSLITIPPPQMVQNMKIGKMDGYCVGEPWGQRAIADGVGFTALTTQDLWKDHPDKGFAFTAAFADKNPKTVIAALKAMHEASVWLDDMNNRSEACDIISQPTYVNCPKDIILKRMMGILDYGDGRKMKDETYMMTFSKRGTNYPQPKYVKWFLSQYRRWGMVGAGTDYEGIANKVMRPDLYEAAMKEIGFAHGGLNNSPETFFDGKTFDPANPEAYGTSFPVHSMKG